MDKQKFIEKFNVVSDKLDIRHVDEVITGCIDRVADEFPQYERGHINIMTAMEESAELIQAASRRMRNRTNDNYEILEESADVIMAILCICQIFDISHDEIRKAINVKIDREVGRIEQHKQECQIDRVRRE